MWLKWNQLTQCGKFLCKPACSFLSGWVIKDEPPLRTAPFCLRPHVSIYLNTNLLFIIIHFPNLMQQNTPVLNTCLAHQTHWPLRTQKSRSLWELNFPPALPSVCAWWGGGRSPHLGSPAHVHARMLSRERSGLRESPSDRRFLLFFSPCCAFVGEDQQSFRNSKMSHRNCQSLLTRTSW